MNDKKILKQLLIGAAIIIGLWAGFYYSNVIYMPEVITGTYTKGTGDFISIDEKDSSFYYTNDYSHIYIKGTLAKQDDGAYAITCPHPLSQAIIPNQTVICQANNLCLVMNGQETHFQKDSNVPALILNRNYQ